MLRIVKSFPDIQRISKLGAGIDNTGCRCVRIVRRFFVRCPEKCIGAWRSSAHAVLVRSGYVVDIGSCNTVFHIDNTAKMNQNRIPFRSLWQIVRTAAPDIADFGKPCPVANHCHLA